MEGTSNFRSWKLLRRDRATIGAAALFALIAAFCLAAPVYARDVAHTGPNASHLLSTIFIDGRSRAVVSSGGYVIARTGRPCPFSGTLSPECRIRPSLPVGPTWFSAGGRFLLGADGNGRDLAVRLLYGGRTSLMVGVAAAALCLLIATMLALLAGYLGGWVDFLISRVFEVALAFPVILFAIALGTSLTVGGVRWLGLHPGSLWIPTAIIALVQVPYVGRPLRGQVLALRESAFVEAAEAIGSPTWRIILRELLPNIAGSVVVFAALIVANSILFEAALSFLGVGIQPPQASWGALVADGQALIVSRPWLTVAPGLAITLTALSLNVIADGIRRVLDPRPQRRSL